MKVHLDVLFLTMLSAHLATSLTHMYNPVFDSVPSQSPLSTNAKVMCCAKKGIFVLILFVKCPI